MGLRQSDLSAETGLPTSHLSDIEREVITPTIPTLSKIGKALNRPLEYFFQESSDKPRSIGMAIHRTPLGGQLAAVLAQLVEEKTGGDIKLRIYYNAAEVTVRDMLEGLAEGAVHIYIDEPLGFERYAELGGPVFLPYFFQDRDQYHRFLQSSIFDKHIYQKLIESGIRLMNPVSNWDCGSFEVLFSMDPIFTPDDLQGRKFRSYASDAAVALRRDFQSEPVIVEWERTYEAFEAGDVDTLMLPAAHFYSVEIHKLAKYATLLEYGYTLNMAVAISEREYHKLSPSVQHALAEAIEETGMYCTQLTRVQTKKELGYLSEKHGLPVIHPDQDIWRKRFNDSIRQVCENGLLAPGKYQELQSV
jgi:TRAP-type C4-dicarboxylate transport system substrate-binding protein